MSTTKDFDNFPEEVKKCQNKETFEECSHRKLMKGAVTKCGCLPGPLYFLDTSEVRKSNDNSHFQSADFLVLRLLLGYF